MRVSQGISGTITNDLYGVISDEVITPVQGEPIHTLVQEPGVELSPGQSGIVYDPCAPTTVLMFSHQITNTGNFTDTFSLTAVSSLGWADLDINPVLAPGEIALFDVEIVPFCPTPPGTIDLTTITATSSADFSVTATITDTTKIGYRKFLPILTKD